jgi:hypothetical protein
MSTVHQINPLSPLLRALSFAVSPLFIDIPPKFIFSKLCPGFNGRSSYLTI